MDRIAVIAVIVCVAGVGGCASPIIANGPQLCQDWREISVSKHDRLTQATAAQIEAGNEARKNWSCSA